VGSVAASFQNSSANEFQALILDCAEIR